MQEFHDRSREARRVAALDRFMENRPQLLLIVDGCHVPGPARYIAAAGGSMAATESTMLALGTPAPAFRLTDFNGKVSTLEDFAAARGLVVAFICNHCPFVKHMRNEFARFARDYQSKGIAVVAICSNDTDAYPQDGPEGMAEEARAAGYTFPYLFDPTQSVAKAYDAACTPDLYLFDGQRKLFYRGQFDESRPGRGTPTGKDLRAACDALLGGAGIPASQKPSLGCNIKWKG